jgi:hypothetical protein
MERYIQKAKHLDDEYGFERLLKEIPRQERTHELLKVILKRFIEDGSWMHWSDLIPNDVIDKHPECYFAFVNDPEIECELPWSQFQRIPLHMVTPRAIVGVQLYEGSGYEAVRALPDEFWTEERMEEFISCCEDNDVCAASLFDFSPCLLLRFTMKTWARLLCLDIWHSSVEPDPSLFMQTHGALFTKEFLNFASGFDEYLHEWINKNEF